MFGSSGFFVGLENDPFYRPPDPRNFYSTVLDGITLFPEGFMGVVAMSSDGSLALGGAGAVDRVVGSTTERDVGDVLAFNNEDIINNGSFNEILRVSVANNSQSLGGLARDLEMGRGLAINSTGTEIYVGCPGYANDLGAVLVNTVSKPLGNSLSLALGNLLPPDNIVGDRFGWGVAINNNDNILAVWGGCNFTTRRGAVYMYSRTNLNDPTSWVFRQKIDIGAINNADFGRTMALSSSPDNSDHHLIVGAPVLGGVGTVYFYRSNSINGPWTANGTGFISTATGAFNGSSIAVNYDKQKVLIGGQGTNSGRGSVNVYNIVNGSIVFQENLQGFITNGSFGSAMALSGDGNVLYVGQPGLNRGVIRQYYLSDRNDASFNRYTIDNLNTSFGNSSNISSSARYGSTLATNFTGDRFIAAAPNNEVSFSPANRPGYLQLNYVA